MAPKNFASHKSNEVVAEPKNLKEAIPAED
jgi:hypothetical protein